MGVLAEAVALAAAGRPFVLATVVWRRGPTSGRLGAKAVVLPDGSMHGFIGGACAQPTLVRQARQALADGRPRLLALGPAAEADGGRREGVVRVSMACESEGSMEIYLEPMLPAPRVLAVGASPLVDTLVGLATALGWEAASVDQVDEGLAADGCTAVVVATQGRYDEAAVQAALATPAGYVGLVASRRRATAVTGWLRAAGTPADQLARVRAPAGLDLGSVEHTEIAVAVLAELVALRAAGGLRASTEAAPAPAEAVDPVCGMTVDVASAHHVSTWGGRTYYFCAAGCRRAFDERPESFAAAVPAPDPPAAAVVASPPPRPR